MTNDPKMQAHVNHRIVRAREMAVSPPPDTVDVPAVCDVVPALDAVVAPAPDAVAVPTAPHPAPATERRKRKPAP